jgi:hypothetical protein
VKIIQNAVNAMRSDGSNTQRGENTMNVFNDPEGWEARLRQQTLITRSARGRGEEISVTSAVAVVDARFPRLARHAVKSDLSRD